MRKIELPSEELAEELQRHLQERRFTGAEYDKARKTVLFPDDMNPSQWSSIAAAVGKWARGRGLDVTESIKIQSSRPEARQARADPRELEAEAKKKLERLTPERAEERYIYLQSRPISDLSEAEIAERLLLAGRPSEKTKARKE